MLGSHTLMLLEGLRFFKPFPKAVGDDATPQAAGLGSASSAAFRSSTDW